MCLIHDIVEIDAGDTYAYDTEGLKTQKAGGRSQGADLLPASGGSEAEIDAVV